MIPKHCKHCAYFDSLGAKFAKEGICALPKEGEIQRVKAADFCIHEPSLFVVLAAAALKGDE